MATYNLPNQYKGDTFEIITFKFYDDESSSGNEKDLSNYSPKMVVRQTSKTGTITKTLTIGSGLTWTSQAGGVVKVDSFICDFDAGNYFYDLQLTNDNDTTDVKTYLRGNFQVIEDIAD